MKKLFAQLRAKRVRDLLKMAFATIIVSFLGISAINLVYMRGIAVEYARQIDNIEFANGLSRMAQETVARSSWYIVAGREDFSGSAIYDEISAVRSGLERLRDNAASGRQMVDAALSATDTLEGYVDRLREQCETGVPVSYQQRTLAEIDKVAVSLYDVLQEFAYAQITDIARANDRMQRIVVVIVVLLGMLTLAVTAIALGAYRMLKAAVDRPNVELAAMADRIRQGDLTTQVAPPGMEELNQLAGGLNLMSQRIQTLVDQSLAEQRNLQKAEMRALQAQITPHFLYNTFDTIVWLAECGHNEEVVQLTMAFADYYRIALSRGRDFITVEQEMRHVRDYLVIQQMRYGDLLRYEIDVDERMGARLMLKLLLQPIVENALYHGLKNRRGGGKISVRGRLLFDGSLHFSVADDGVGMDEAALEALRREIAAETLPETSGYGLYNVNRRLRLFYDAADLDITSEQGVGTRVEFVLPPRDGGAEAGPRGIDGDCGEGGGAG